MQLAGIMQYRGKQSMAIGFICKNPTREHVHVRRCREAGERSHGCAGLTGAGPVAVAGPLNGFISRYCWADSASSRHSHIDI